MKNRYMIAALLSVLLAGTGVSALAADTQGAPDKSDMMPQGNMAGGMMKGDMMQKHSASDGAMSCGMMDGRMMQHGAMMGGGMMSGMMPNETMGRGMMNGHSMIPQLPAGNEKLQLKMQAEIMQKVGEILAKYADQITVNP